VRTTQKTKNVIVTIVLGQHNKTRLGYTSTVQPMSCIHSACLGGHYHLVESLLLTGCDGIVDSRDEDGETPLNLASRMGFVNIVKLLIDNGADQRLKNNDGVAAVLWAMLESREEVVSFLLRAKNADLNTFDNVSRRTHMCLRFFIHVHTPVF
jgi:ankyrin repeat protein